VSHDKEEHGQKETKPARKIKNYWTKAEEAALIARVNKFRMKWAVILKWS
jgi:hypothetical protein